MKNATVACLILFISVTAGPVLSGPEHASLQGKYRVLIQKLECPRDLRLYGQFHDYGYWSAMAYCGRPVSSGWWVYAHPYWYVWRTNTEMPGTDPLWASVRGKYAKLEKAVICPQDREEYGLFNDWGYWAESGLYCGHRVTPGYWVYLYPYWYIWRVLNL